MIVTAFPATLLGSWPRSSPVQRVQPDAAGAAAPAPSRSLPRCSSWWPEPRCSRARTRCATRCCPASRSPESTWAGCPTPTPRRSCRPSSGRGWTSRCASRWARRSWSSGPARRSRSTSPRPRSAPTRRDASPCSRASAPLVAPFAFGQEVEPVLEPLPAERRTVDDQLRGADRPARQREAADGRQGGRRPPGRRGNGRRRRPAPRLGAGGGPRGGTPGHRDRARGRPGDHDGGGRGDGAAGPHARRRARWRSG